MNIDLLNIEELKEFLLVQGKLINIQVNKDSEDFVNKKINSNKKNIWIISTDFDDLCLRFNSTIFSDIKKVFNSKLNINTEVADFYYLSFTNKEAVNTFIKDINELPFILLTQEGQALAGIEIDSIDFKNL